LGEQVVPLFNGVNGDFVGGDEPNLHPIARIDAFPLLEQLTARDAQDDAVVFGQPNFNAHSTAGDDEPSHPFNRPVRRSCAKV
jgi:hypothetical protein